MNKLGFIRCALLAALILIAGCATRITDPLVGWKRADYLSEPNQAIVKDYQDHIQALPPEEKQFAYVNLFFEDGLASTLFRSKCPYTELGGSTF